MPKTG